MQSLEEDLQSKKEALKALQNAAAEKAEADAARNAAEERNKDLNYLQGALEEIRGVEGDLTRLQKDFKNKYSIAGAKKGSTTKGMRRI